MPLLTHENEKVRFYDDLIKGRHVVINLTYAQCSDICPMMTANLVKVQQILGKRVGRDIFMYSISLTPEQDTPAVLKHYAKNFGVNRADQCALEILNIEDIDPQLRRYPFHHPPDNRFDV